MTPTDKRKLLELLPDVCAFYRQDFSKFLGSVWVAAMEAYTFDEVSKAIERHTMNPDSGQFMPKPADVVRMLGGTSIDVAMGAWSKVERALRTIGQYESVVFDDPLIHRVVMDMGGWVKLCTASQTEKDLEFVAREFQTRYRGFAMRRERPEFPGRLVGFAEAQNAQEGINTQISVRAIGDPKRCWLVLSEGQDENGAPGRQALMLVPKAELLRLTASTR
jgi:hypothetical protein